MSVSRAAAFIDTPSIPIRSGLQASFRLASRPHAHLAEPRHAPGAVLPGAALSAAFLSAAHGWSDGVPVRFIVQVHPKGGHRHMLMMQGRGQNVTVCENVASGAIYRLNQPRREKRHWSDRAIAARNI